jgi:hypothetical protein
LGQVRDEIQQKTCGNKKVKRNNKQSTRKVNLGCFFSFGSPSLSQPSAFVKALNRLCLKKHMSCFLKQIFFVKAKLTFLSRACKDCSRALIKETAPIENLTSKDFGSIDLIVPITLPSMLNTAAPTIRFAFPSERSAEIPPDGQLIANKSPDPITNVPSSLKTVQSVVLQKTTLDKKG